MVGGYLLNALFMIPAHDTFSALPCRTLPSTLHDSRSAPCYLSAVCSSQMVQLTLRKDNDYRYPFVAIAAQASFALHTPRFPHTIRLHDTLARYPCQHSTRYTQNLHCTLICTLYCTAVAHWAGNWAGNWQGNTHNIRKYLLIFYILCTAYKL